jgi:hypothetical protein
VRIRFRDVHPLEKMIAALPSIELTRIVPSLLNDRRIARRHLSVGVRWDSFIRSEHSIFTSGATAISMALFLCTAIDLSGIDVFPIPDGNWRRELLNIEEFGPRVCQEEVTSLGESAFHPRPGVLSSTQIFLGIPGSSHRLNLITSSNHTAALLAKQDEEVENSLRLIYCRSVRMPELRTSVRSTAQEIRFDRRTGRTRHAWLEWICPHWNLAERCLRSFAGSLSSGTVKGDCPNTDFLPCRELKLGILIKNSLFNHLKQSFRAEDGITELVNPD